MIFMHLQCLQAGTAEPGMPLSKLPAHTPETLEPHSRNHKLTNTVLALGGNMPIHACVKGPMQALPFLQ